MPSARVVERLQVVEDREPGFPAGLEATIVAKRGDRITDTKPFVSGDYLYNAARQAECTSGFNLNDSSGNQYVLTAGHCGGVGTTFRKTDLPNSTVVGQVTRQCFINRASCDGDIIKVGTASTLGISPFTWGGTFYGTGPNQRVVSSVATTDPIGGLICQGGWATNDDAGAQLLCNLKITATNLCEQFTDNITTCGLVNAVYAPDMSRQVEQAGDSGGPVLTTINSNAAVARGEIIGGYGASAIGYNNNLLYLPQRVVQMTFGLTTKLYQG